MWNDFILMFTYTLKLYLWGCIISCVGFVLMVTFLILIDEDRKGMTKDWLGNLNDTIKAWFIYTFLSFIGIGTIIQVFYMRIQDYFYEQGEYYKFLVMDNFFKRGVTKGQLLEKYFDLKYGILMQQGLKKPQSVDYVIKLKARFIRKYNDRRYS